MKNLIIIALGLIISMSANALELTDISLGLKHVGVPSGIATIRISDYSDETRTYDNSDKYRQGYETVNLTFDQDIVRTERNLIGIRAMVSSGYQSEALKVQPYIAPMLYWVSSPNDSLTFFVYTDLPVIGGSISEKIWVDKYKSKYSYATARSWSEWEDFGGIQMQQSDTISAGFTFKY